MECDVESQIVLRISSALGAAQLCVLSADLASTIYDVKMVVERVEGTPVREQRLLLGRHVCHDDSRSIAEVMALIGKQQTADSGTPECLELVLVRLDPKWV